MNFGEAFEYTRQSSGEFAMRLPSWPPDIMIKSQHPDAHSKMSTPYLYVESRFGRVPRKATMIELFSEKWEVVNLTTNITIRTEDKVQVAESSADDKEETAQPRSDVYHTLMRGKGTFGHALQAIKNGEKVARIGWNNENMFVYYVPGNTFPAQTGAAKSYFGEGMVSYSPYMALKNPSNTVSTWVPSVNDCLSEDWLLVEFPTHL